MAPIIQIGDTLEIVSKLDSIKTFDIILFKRNGHLVVHFVWRNQIKYNSTLITRSLENFFEDEEPIEIKSVVGLVTNFKISRFLKIKIFFLNILKGTV